MQHTVGFVQVNFQTGPREFNNYYLPYSAGMILAYALQDPAVSQHWTVDHVVWRRDPIEHTARLLAPNHIVAFSTYVWNRRYNAALARRIKELRPQTKIVFGGPEPAIHDAQLFQQHPYIDVVVKLEGERIFRDILLRDGEDLDQIPGLVLNHHGVAVDTGSRERINDVDELPSPYLTGIFDRIIAHNPEVTWSATLETNRGCPFQCTFCDWGSLTYNKIKKFNLERVYAELEWMGQHCGYVMITDANFGAFEERDSLIVDKLLEVQARHGRIKNFTMTWAKNQKNHVVDLVKRIIDRAPGAGRGLTVSTQSMDLQVLDNIRRRNLDQHKLQEIFALCDRKGVPVYTEVILGLPGETARSWREGIYRIFRAGNHYGINILQAQLLTNAEMNLGQRSIFRLESCEVYDYIDSTYQDEHLAESVDVVISTSTIDREQMLELMTWNTFIQCFHFNGVSTWVSRFLERQSQIDYSDFYDRLYSALAEHDWFRTEFDRTRQYFRNWTTQGRTGHPDIGGVRMVGWNLVYRLSMQIQLERRMPWVMDLMSDFVLDYGLDSDMHQDLMQFQRLSVMRYETLRDLPITMNSRYDFLGYLVHGTRLERPCQYEFSTREDVNMSQQTFLENYHFGRARNFGKTRIQEITGSNAEQSTFQFLDPGTPLRSRHDAPIA